MERILIQDLLEKILESTIYEDGKELDFIGTTAIINYTREEKEFNAVVVKEKQVPMLQIVCREWEEGECTTMNCDVVLDSEDGSLEIATKYLTNIGISIDTALSIVQIISNVTGYNILLTCKGEVEHTIEPLV